MFRVLPRDATLDELWLAGLLYSRNTTRIHPEWAWDSPEQLDSPTQSEANWEFAIFVEE